jgi:periplasmic protein TonB
MPKPLRSEDPNPKDMQFAHFGVLNSGAQSKASLFTSITVNVLLGLICLIIGAATKKVVDNRNKEIAYVVPLPKPVEPPKPKLPSPPKLPPPPKLPEPPKIEPPKIKLPDVPIPEPPKPVAVVAPKPLPVVAMAQPKIQVAAAAPKVVAITNIAKSASVVNNDPHPAPVALGNPNSPVPFQKAGPAVAPVNMNRGMSGMPPENSGGGPRATAVNMGNGSPGGKIGGTAPVAVAGVKMGCVGCTGDKPGNGTGNQPQQVQMAHLGVAPVAMATTAIKAPASHPPQVLYKPKPAYTAEATSLHIEGTVTVRIHVSAGGAVSVIGVVSGLGHGLDQSAIAAAQAIRFKPATDAAGNSVDWEGPVNITFQIAS